MLLLLLLWSRIFQTCRFYGKLAVTNFENALLKRTKQICLPNEKSYVVPPTSVMRTLIDASDQHVDRIVAQTAPAATGVDTVASSASCTVHPPTLTVASKWWFESTLISRDNS